MDTIEGMIVLGSTTIHNPSHYLCEFSSLIEKDFILIQFFTKEPEKKSSASTSLFLSPDVYSDNVRTLFSSLSISLYEVETKKVQYFLKYV